MVGTAGMDTLLAVEVGGTGGVELCGATGNERSETQRSTLIC